MAGRGGRQDSADFAGMFAALLEAAQLTVDKVLRELEKQGQPTVVSRATVYDWAKGSTFPQTRLHSGPLSGCACSVPGSGASFLQWRMRLDGCRCCMTLGGRRVPARKRSREEAVEGLRAVRVVQPASGTPWRLGYTGLLAVTRCQPSCGARTMSCWTLR